MTRYCPNCGEELVDKAKFCKSCGYDLENHKQNDYINDPGQYRPPVEEKSHTVAMVLGYICAVLIPLFGIIFGIYLLTREEQKAKTHGKYVIIVAAAIWLISFILMMR
jgi:uncharacterized membrane protein YvbJ